MLLYKAMWRRFQDKLLHSPWGVESRVITNFNYFFKPVAVRWFFPSAEAYANNRLALGINLTPGFFLRDKELTSKEVIKSEDIRGFLLIVAFLTSGFLIGSCRRTNWTDWIFRLRTKGFKSKQISMHFKLD